MNVVKVINRSNSIHTVAVKYEFINVIIVNISVGKL